jgi:hypothetical protein
MAEYNFHELKHTKVSVLRDIASRLDPPIEGYSQFNKEQLIDRICRQLNIEVHGHREVQGIDKAPVKKQIRDLKKSRDAAIAAHDREKLRDVRRRIHRLKRTIRKATV